MQGQSGIGASTSDEGGQGDLARLRARAAALDAREDALAVITHVDVMPRHTAEAEALLHQYARDTLAAAGAARCDVLQELARPNHFTLVEVWATRRAFDDHRAAAATRRFREVLHPLLGSPFDERLHRSVRDPAG